MRARLSTKMVGETLEQHGEIVSIMFEIKTVADRQRPTRKIEGLRRDQREEPSTGRFDALNPAGTKVIARSPMCLFAFI
jgi:hypothetical protein